MMYAQSHDHSPFLAFYASRCVFPQYEMFWVGSHFLVIYKATVFALDSASCHTGLWLFECASIFSPVTFWPYRFLDPKHDLECLVWQTHCLGHPACPRSDRINESRYLFSLSWDWALALASVWVQGIHYVIVSILLHKWDLLLPGITDISADNWKQGPSRSRCQASQLLYDESK